MTSHSNTVSRLTVADVDRADVRKLAEMLRRECEHDNLPEGFARNQRMHFAAALLAVLDECRELTSMHALTDNEFIRNEERHRIIRAAARAWLAAGGTLPAPEGE